MNNSVFAVGVGTDLLSIVRTLGAKGVECWACASQQAGLGGVPSGTERASNT